MRCKFSGFGSPADLAFKDRVCVDGDALYADDEGKPAALHRDHYWDFRGNSYIRVDIAGPLVIRLVPSVAGKHEVVMTRDSVWFADGVLHTPDGHIVALDDPTKTWIDAKSGATYTQIILMPIRAGTGTGP